MISTVLDLLKMTPLSRAEQAAALGVSEDRLRAWVKGRIDYALPGKEHVTAAVLLVKRHVKRCLDVLDGVRPGMLASPVLEAPALLPGENAVQIVASAVEILPAPRWKVAELLGVSRDRLDSWCIVASSGVPVKRFNPPSREIVERARSLFRSHRAAVEARARFVDPPARDPEAPPWAQ